jgi:hypothetical protein
MNDGRQFTVAIRLLAYRFHVFAPDVFFRGLHVASSQVRQWERTWCSIPASNGLPACFHGYELDSLLAGLPGIQVGHRHKSVD